MHFGLSDEQMMLQDTLRRCLDERLPIERLKRILEAPGDPDLWRAVVELGVSGALIPESLGGSGLGMLEAEVIAEAMGRAVAPLSYLSTTVLAPLAWRLAGSAAQQDRYLPPIAAGEHRYGVGLTESTGAARETGGLVLDRNRATGRCFFVLDAGDATHFLLATGSDTLVLAARDARGLQIEMLKSVDKTRTFAVLSLDRTPIEVLGQIGAAHDALQTLLAAGRLALAADSFGAAEVMLKRARDYSLERFQFNRPIGSFQGVKHLLADMVTELEPCRSLLWYSAHAFDAEPDERILHACHSKAHVNEMAKFVARSAIEIHGGMGYTEQLGLQLWYKRIEANRQLLGGPEVARHVAAVCQGWVAPSTGIGPAHTRSVPWT